VERYHPVPPTTMRKVMKRKRKSCAMCKPWKMGGSNRWKAKDYMLLKEFDKSRREW
jgi:hypothetical protein